MAVARGDERQSLRLGQLAEPLVDGVLLGDAAVDELDVEAAGKKAGKAPGKGSGLVHVASGAGPGQGALEAGREAEEGACP